MRRTLILALGGLLAFLAAHLSHFGWRPSALCDFGSRPLAEDPRYKTSASASFRPGFVLMDGANADGYDGQYYYFIACDPLARRAQGGYASAYYWQRILHPALAWALAGGDPGRIPAAMAAVTLLAILLGAWALLRMQAHPGWVLAYAWGVGHLYGLQLSVGGPALSLSLSLLALLAWQEERGGLAALLLALSLLARESSVLVALPLCAFSFLKGRRRDAVLAALSVLPLLAWNLYLKERFGGWGLGTSGNHVTFPLAGILERARSLKGSGVDFASSGRGMANNAVLLAFLAWGAWVAVDAAWSWIRGTRSLPALLYLANAGFFCCLTSKQVVDLNGASRPFLTVLPFLVLCRSGSRAGKALLAVGLLFSAAVFLKVALAHPEFHLYVMTNP